ncbi:MAG: MerR family transcriptional regulator [Candidatus Omnitrophica bacterium]|nr:MerR family transcriptional regulator [Candidatus Omnitrophota bacterium]
MAAKKNPNDDIDEFILDLDEPVFTTGVVCRLLDIPVWILKQLDREQIVSPPRKKEGKARLYSQRELKMVKHCWYYISERGVNMNGLKVILKIEEKEIS